MARKTKEELNKINEEIVEKSTKKAVKSTNKNKTVAKSKSAAESAVKKEPAKKITSTSKNKTTKKVASSPKKENPKKENPKKENPKKVKATSKKETTKEVKITPKKEASKKVKNKENENVELKPKTVAKKTKDSTIKNKETEIKKLSATTKKKAETKKASTTKKKAEVKEASTTKKKAEAKKTSTITSKKATVKKASTKKKKTTSKKSRAKSNVVSLNPIEYYDLPYRYNETVVKVLAQNPNTLFVYWDISDNDREILENQYGKLFFYNTRPVLVVHNLTDNYTFEIDIDDFANNWYVNVNDTKCKYFVELGRRPKYDNHDAIPVNYLKVASSNTIEMPNDHILFFKDNDKIYFKNIKTNRVTEKIFKSKTYSSKLRGIYSNYNLSEKDDRFDFKNPSSQNPTSNVL